jgi:Xaa-Pro aminopeptidase
MAGGERPDYQDRVRRAQAVMADHGVDALAIGVGSDLLYLAAYPAHTSERLTLLIVPKEGEPKIVVPQLEAPRLGPAGVPFAPVAWEETADPSSIAADIIWETGARSVASGNELWASFLIKLQRHLPEVKWDIAGDIMRELRMCKDKAEVDLLREASHRTDDAWVDFTQTKIAGLTERQAAERLMGLMRDHGMESVAFCIAASGPNSASPHYNTADRVIQEGDAIVFDFGGRYQHYVSDITRTVHIGEPSDEYRKVYDVVLKANEAAFAAVRPGVACQEIDRAARKVITDAGYGEYFIHRVGHGLGLDVHEEPYMVEGNDLPLRVGMVFSDEPGIYIPGKFGVRIEDSVVCTETGGEKLNGAPRDLLVMH